MLAGFGCAARREAPAAPCVRGPAAGLPPVGVTGVPGAVLLGASVGTPQPNDALLGTSLGPGTAIFVSLRAKEGRFLGLVAEQSRVLTFFDDRGRPLLDDQARVTEGHLAARGESMVLVLRTGRVASPDTRRVRVRVRVTVELSTGETVVQATFAPGEQRVVTTPAGPLPRR